MRVVEIAPWYAREQTRPGVSRIRVWHCLGRVAKVKCSRSLKGIIPAKSTKPGKVLSNGAQIWRSSSSGPRDPEADGDPSRRRGQPCKAKGARGLGTCPLESAWQTEALGDSTAVLDAVRGMLVIRSLAVLGVICGVPGPRAPRKTAGIHTPHHPGRSSTPVPGDPVSENKPRTNPPRQRCLQQVIFPERNSREWELRIAIIVATSPSR